ncbi:MAG: glycosyltransferase family 4 protein [Pyrinomonadaceae bacterium]
MKILVGMPAKDSWGGPIASEPPFVDALRSLGETVTEEVYVYGDKATPTAFFQRVARVVRTALRFRGRLSSESFDLIHLNTAFDLKTIFRDAFSIFVMAPGKTKVFLKIHGSEAERFERAGFPVSLLIKYLARRVDGFGVHTREEKLAFAALGIAAEKLYFVKNAITIAENLPAGYVRPVKEKGAAIQLLFVSRFIPAKGLIETIKACAILRDREIDFVLNCVGEGESRTEAERLTAELDLSSQVTFTGHIPEASVTEYLFSSDILVFPTSHSEGFPNVLFKAVAAGLPVVTTAIRAAADYLSEPENGLFCTADPKNIAARLEHLINDPGLRSAMSDRNIAFGRTLAPGPIAEEFVAVYRQILEG